MHSEATDGTSAPVIRACRDSRLGHTPGARPSAGARRWILAAFLVCAAGCKMRREEAVKPSPPPVAPAQQIAAGQWANTWPGDAEKVTLTPRPDGTLEVVVQGKPAAGNKGAILSATLGDWRLAEQAGARLTASCMGGDMKIALAVRTDQYYESPPQAVSPGEPRELSFDLSAANFMSDRSGWKFTDTIRRDTAFQAVELVLYPVAGETRALTLQPLQLTGVEVPPPRAVSELSILKVTAPEKVVPRFGRFEITAEVSAACTNPFDPAQMTVDATFQSPSGTTYRCPGFLYAFGRSEGAGDEWRVRFSPNEEGPWSWSLTVATPGKAVSSEPRKMMCSGVSGRGPVRLSAADPRFFEYADGTFYYPIGHNVCWNSLEQYQEQFAQMGKNGENWSRIWIAPWNCDIEWSSRGGPYKGLGQYNLENARKLDEILEAAEAGGLSLQLVLHEHCRLSAKTNPEWQNNPYNKALGGPCDAPQDFFTNEKARRLARNRIRYIVARWGWSPNVLAWELFNEVDLTDDFRFASDTAWHKEMAEFIKALDPHRHLVTTSYISNPNAQTYRLAAIDYTQSHAYVPDVVSHFVQILAPFVSLGKPHFIAEFGRNSADGEDAKDTEARTLRSGIWAQFMLPEAGNAMSWWWYDHIHPHNLYPVFKALSKFAEGIDRRGAEWSLQTGALPAEWGPMPDPSLSPAWRVLALVSPDTACAWLYDPAILPWSEKPVRPDTGFQGHLALEGLAPGVWKVEQWDTIAGAVVRAEDITVTAGSLTLPVTARGADVAFKLRRLPGGEPSTNRPRLKLEAWDPRTAPPKPRARLGIPKCGGPVMVDGGLDDWSGVKGLVVEPRDGRSPADNSFAFSACHDADNLFVAVRVTDNQVVRENKGDALWKDDCVEIWVDSRNDSGFFGNMPYNPGCFQFNLAPALQAGAPPDKIIYRNPAWTEELLAQVEAASQITSNGYVIEARIPLSALRGPEPLKDPAAIGFNVSTCDADKPVAGPSWNHLLWQGSNEWDATEWSVGVLE